MKNNNQNWYILAGLALALLFVAIIFRPLFYILIILGCLLMIFGISFFIINFLWKLGKTNTKDLDIESSLERQLVQCKEQILKNKSEIRDIQRAIDELRLVT